MELEKNKKCLCGVSSENINQAPPLISRMLEKLKFTCKNKIEGCKEVTNYKELKLHEKKC